MRNLNHEKVTGVVKNYLLSKILDTYIIKSVPILYIFRAGFVQNYSQSYNLETVSFSASLMFDADFVYGHDFGRLDD